MSADQPDREEALRLALQLLAIVGPPAIAAVARTVRSEWPELVDALNRALESEPPPIMPTPPSAEEARAVLRSRREERRTARRSRR